MDKVVYLAVAGSGKTYSLCNSINKEKRNFIIAFTNQNISNIRRELLENFQCIPENTSITTFHSFIYNDFLRPYEYVVWDKYTNKKPIKTMGITIKDAPESTYPQFNPYYIKDSEIGHYIDSITKKYYCGRISKLISKCGITGIINKGVNRLEKFYDCLYIDEFQDFRKYDYDVLNNIVKRIKIPCYLYGDFYQHSVSGTNNYGKPFENKTYEDFIRELEEKGFLVDVTTLKDSRRCSNDVCKFVREKLEIEIYSQGKNEGEIRFITDYDDIKRIILDDDIVKLFYNNAKKQNCRGINWGYSKGDTYLETCIIIPDNFNLTDINTNKFYVALTRSKGNVYLLNAKDYKGCLEKLYSQDKG